MSGITIGHTSAGGTVVEGTARGDGSAAVLRAARWKWSRNIGPAGAWYRPQSRDRAPDLYAIDRAADQLRAAGFAVVVEVDAAPRDQVEAEADRAERMEARADALQAKAGRRRDEATARLAAAHEIGERMQGEPIHVGHHSERHHRADIRRFDRHMDSFCEALGESQKADRGARVAERHMARREAPLVVARRIERLETDLRDVRRKLNGTSRNGMEYGQRAAGVWRDQLEASATHLEEQLRYWRSVRADQADAGRAREWAAGDLQPGDLVMVRGHWRRVERVNRTTVSVETPYSWRDRVPFREITGHERPGQPSPLAGAGLSTAAPELGDAGDVEPGQLVLAL